MKTNFILVAILFWFASSGVANAAPIKVVPQNFKETKAQYSIDFSYPRTGNRAIDKMLEDWARGLAQDFVTDAKNNDDKRAWAGEVTYEIGRNDSSAFSVVFTYYTNTGGAHPNSMFETFYFLLPDGYRAEFAEIFTPRGIARISDISIAILKRDLGGPDGMTDTDWIKKGAGANARNFAHFVLLPTELVIYFDAYQVAAYAAGPQEVRIPLSQVRDTMRSNVRAPAASFDCRLARSDVEHAICSSRDLARLDRLLGEAYANKLTWAEDDAKRSALRQTQRDWLKMRDAACLRAGTSLQTCLTPFYQNRLKVLSDES